MKKMFSGLLIIFAVSILMTPLFGCQTYTQVKVEQWYGPPAKKEIVDDKIIYYYYFTGRRSFSYQPYTMCVDITFDKNGKVINKRESESVRSAFSFLA